MKISNKRVCNVCGSEAKIWHVKHWWCSFEVKEGKFNLVGFCPKEKK